MTVRSGRPFRRRALPGDSACSVRQLPTLGWNVPARTEGSEQTARTCLSRDVNITDDARGCVLAGGSFHVFGFEDPAPSQTHKAGVRFGWSEAMAFLVAGKIRGRI